MTKNLLPIHDLVGQVLTDLGAHYEVLIFRFGEYEIHASSFARVIRNKVILLTTQDYQNWDEEEYTHNDMYLNIAKHGASLIGQKVCAVEVSDTTDLFVRLENDARIEIFNSSGELYFAEEVEQWYFYKPKDPSYPPFSVERTKQSNGI